MNDSSTVRLAFSILKAAVFLGIGALLGFLLGLAYASHLYGTPPVVMQIQNWLAGDSLYEKPLPVDQQGKLMNSQVAIIPRIGACIGFGISASILSGSIMLRTFLAAVKSGKTARNSKRDDGDES